MIGQCRWHINESSCWEIKFFGEKKTKQQTQYIPMAKYQLKSPRPYTHLKELESFKLVPGSVWVNMALLSSNGIYYIAAA